MQESLYILCVKGADVSQRLDTGEYSPKELAAKEGVTATSVYSWLRAGLPHKRRGQRGTILIPYQAYLKWTIDSAIAENSGEKPERSEIPEWATRYARQLGASETRGG